MGGSEGGREGAREGAREGRKEGSRAKPGNQLVYYIKLQLPFVCVSVCTPVFRLDRRTATKFGTHIRIDMGLTLS